MQAILSDVHGNLEALLAVLADIRQQGVSSVCHLGDLLGYGPNPAECLDLAMPMEFGLLGNFDSAVLNTPDGFCHGAEQSILWTQAILRADHTTEAGRRRLTYLAGLPIRHQVGDVLYVHGSARGPTHEYIFPEDIHNPEKLMKIGAHFERLCFGGHTHIPGLFRQRSEGNWEYLHAEECERGFPVEDGKIMCNVGAVGQPRDGDERACYALYDGDRIWIRRVEYDFEPTIRKIYAVPELLNFLGDRLREGR